MSTYDIFGRKTGEINNTFAENMHMDYEYDSVTNANYTVLRIYKNRIDGSRQYPFVYAPNGAGAGTQSTLGMNMEKKFSVAINGGVFYTDSANANKPRGIVVQNGVLIQQGVSESRIFPLVIDESGDFSYAQPDADGATLIANGAVSVISGWAPIIINYDDAPLVISGAYHDDTNAQRQIIGQFGNGDYAIVTCEGRNYDHSDGWTIDEAITICKKIGLKFAYNLDGGGSTETVIGKKQINTIYEGTYGRVVPTYIVFNGTDNFSVPN